VVPTVYADDHAGLLRLPVELEAGEAQAQLALAAVVARLHGMPRPRLTPNTVVHAVAAVACVDDAARLGYATTDQELELGVRSMAVPVFTRRGALVAELSTAVRAERFEMATFVDTFLPALQRAQARLAAQLG
jgi:IclR family pca regulon transcriptional regulator